MKTALYTGLLIVIAGVFYLIGYSINSNYVEVSDTLPTTEEKVDFEQAVKNYPRGSLGIPAQWFIMDSMIGAEKMMLIFGYADNKAICEHTVELAKEESPERSFRCEDAN